jgi:hypothetical protein
VHVVTFPLRRPSTWVMIAAIAGAAIVVAVRAIPEPRPRPVLPRSGAVELEPLCGTSLREPSDREPDRSMVLEH